MSKKKNKYAFWNGEGFESIQALQSAISSTYKNKFYNLWMSKYKWTGLDEEVADQQENFIMRKLWSEGKIAMRLERTTNLMVFTAWTQQSINFYGLPEEVNLINLNNAPLNLIPSTPQKVNKDVVIGYAMPNHKPVRSLIQYYIDRMVQVEMVINTNLQLQKMPWLIACDEEDKNKMEDLIRRILQNEIVVFADIGALNKIQSVATQTPYVIDKLRDHLRDLESEVLTLLGIDNNNNSKLEQTHISIDAVNANNDIINAYDYSITEEINKFLRKIKMVFGRELKIEKVIKQVASIHEEQPQPQPQDENQGGTNNE